MSRLSGSRGAWTLLWIGAALACAGTLVGILAGTVGVDQAFEHGPTPQHMSAELHRAVIESLVGFCIAVVGGLLLMFAFAKLRIARRGGEGEPPDSFSSNAKT